MTLKWVHTAHVTAGALQERTARKFGAAMVDQVDGDVRVLAAVLPRSHHGPYGAVHDVVAAAPLPAAGVFAVLDGQDVGLELRLPVEAPELLLLCLRAAHGVAACLRALFGLSLALERALFRELRRVQRTSFFGRRSHGYNPIHTCLGSRHLPDTLYTRSGASSPASGARAGTRSQTLPAFWA